MKVARGCWRSAWISAEERRLLRGNGGTGGGVIGRGERWRTDSDVLCRGGMDPEVLRCGGSSTSIRSCDKDCVDRTGSGMAARRLSGWKRGWLEHRTRAYSATHTCIPTPTLRRTQISFPVALSDLPNVVEVGFLQVFPEVPAITESFRTPVPVAAPYPWYCRYVMVRHDCVCGGGCASAAKPAIRGRWM